LAALLAQHEDIGAERSADEACPKRERTCLERPAAPAPVLDRQDGGFGFVIVSYYFK
jgi:hypothetical protein